MAQVSALKSGPVTNLDASPFLRPGSWVHGGNAKHYAGTVETLATDSIGSTYRFLPGRLVDAAGHRLRCSAMRSAPPARPISASTSPPPKVEPSWMRTSSPLRAIAAATNGTDITLRPLAAMDISKIEQRIWEVLGLTTDPNLEYDVVATLTAATVAGGTLSLRGTFTW
jgi:hypothetical protein